jgi:methionyl-tRNA synthetase
MTKNKQTFTITAALPYANGPIHIGHLAGVYIPADIYARYKRLSNNDVAFICGSDEHGVAISLASKKASLTPKELVDKYHKLINESLENFGITFDNYSRTSNKIHHSTSLDFFQTLKEKKLFKLIESEQFFDEEENQFLADRYIIGNCPICDFDKAYGDQCEKCGSTLSPEELINPKSTISNSKPIKKNTKHYYIKLDEFEDFIGKWITKEKKDIWKPNVVGQVKAWLESGLKPRAVTRDLDWGIPVEVEGEKGKVLYVWFEAPIGYISSTIEWAEKNKKDWKKYWKDDKTNLIHFIGKDNIVFHCIIFPIMLKMYGDFIIPENVPANEFLNLEGDKISTSRNWAVWLHEYLTDFPEMQDVLRYVLTSTCPETKDNDFTWKDFQTRNNSELVSIYGNFANRVLSLIIKYYNGKIPNPSESIDFDKNIINEVFLLKENLEYNLNHFKFREALKNLISIARIGNKYLADSEPWKLKDLDPERVNQILNTSFKILTYLSVLSEPFLPFTSTKLKKMIGVNCSDWSCLDDISNLINYDFKLDQIEILFRRVEDSEIEFQINKLKNTFNK